MTYRPIRIPATALACAMLLLYGCSGGGTATLAVGGTSGSGVVGGTSGSGITAGTVNGFGSVVVGGTTYQTSSDDPAIDTEFVGPSAGFAEQDLAPGMRVQVIWEEGDQAESRYAGRITYLPELVGPVTVAATTTGGMMTLSVAGRTVELPTASVFDDSYARQTAGVPALSSAAELQSDRDLVEVSGFLLERDPATGASVIRASRVARTGVASGADPEETITGIVDASSGGRFIIADAGGAAITVDFDAAAVADDGLFDGSSQRLSEGSRVRVTGQLNGMELAAVSRISRPLDDLQPDSDDEVAAEIQGPLTALPNAAGELRVTAQRVRVDADTEFSGGDPDDLQLGQQLRIEGILQAPEVGERVLLAREIRIEAGADVALVDTIVTAVSMPASGGVRTFETGIGLTVQIEPGTLLKDDSAASGNGRLAANALAIGDAVAVDGYFDTAGRLVATTLERQDAAVTCEMTAGVRGSAMAGTARRYTIADRPGLVIVDVSSASSVIADGDVGRFSSAGGGDCTQLPDGTDVDGTTVDAGFLAGEVEEQ